VEEKEKRRGDWLARKDKVYTARHSSLGTIGQVSAKSKRQAKKKFFKKVRFV